MRRPTIAVHHFVANLTTRQYGPNPTSDLLGVDHRHAVPADAEFPSFLSRVDLFTRFYVTSAPPAEFVIRVWWRDGPKNRRPPVQNFGPFLVPFGAAEVARDHVFRLVNVRLDGVGWHTIRLLRVHGAGWRAGRGAPAGRTHIFVEQ